MRWNPLYSPRIMKESSNENDKNELGAKVEESDMITLYYTSGTTVAQKESFIHIRIFGPL